ncbi:uncharacterized protein LOC112019922 [Quercus suber]|uniref:uncharacterized protein LOC112019922 n=1 Tax=Quercus suber TaxID=58331 RepID=UPI0032DE964C
MADEVIDGLENMKLTVEEEEVIAISDEGRLTDIESCSLSLIGKFLTCKAFNKRAALNTLRAAWGIQSGIQILEVGSNLFQFKFQSEFDLNRVLKGGPWSFDNQLLMLTKWRRGMTASNVTLDRASLWIQIWGAPFDMVSPQVATEVGSRLGVVEDMERRRRQDAPSYFMRVRVALPVSKPLRRGGFIVDSDGGKTWVHFKYERLPMFCHFCGVLGHDFHHCTRHFAAEKGDGDVEYQYGDWMRAFGGQQRSPPRDRTASPKQQAWRSEKHGMNGDAAVHGENIGIHPDFQQPKPVINEMEQIQGDRSIADMDVVSLNLNSDNPVEVYDNKVGNRDMVEKSVISDIPKDVMGPKFVEDVAEKLEENSGHLNVKCNMQGGNVGGPIVSKPKSTWTRIVRMDFGLGSTLKAAEVPVLGKRLSTQNTILPMQRDEEEI